MTRTHYPIGGPDAPERVCGICRKPWRCPSADTALDPALVMTDVGKMLLERPVFPGIGSKPQPLGGHIAVNGYDLARVEAEAYERGRAPVITGLPSGELSASPDVPDTTRRQESGSMPAPAGTSR